MKSEIRVMHLRSKECQRWLGHSQKLGESQERILPHSLRRKELYPHFDLALLAFKTEKKFCCLGHQLVVVYYSSPNNNKYTLTL